MARIDAPRLSGLHITFFNEVIFDTPQLFQFTSQRPMLRAPEKGCITFNSKAVTVGFLSRISDYGVLSLEISCSAPEWQLSSLEQVCTSSLPPVSTLEDLSSSTVEKTHHVGKVMSRTCYGSVMPLYLSLVIRRECRSMWDSGADREARTRRTGTDPGKSRKSGSQRPRESGGSPEKSLVHWASRSRPPAKCRSPPTQNHTGI